MAFNNAVGMDEPYSNEKILRYITRLFAQQKPNYP